MLYKVDHLIDCDQSHTCDLVESVLEAVRLGVLLKSILKYHELGTEITIMMNEWMVGHERVRGEVVCMEFIY